MKYIQSQLLEKKIFLQDYDHTYITSHRSRNALEKAALLNIDLKQANEIKDAWEKIIYIDFLKILKYKKYRTKEFNERILLKDYLEFLDIELSYRSICMRCRRFNLDLSIVEKIVEFVSEELLYDVNDDINLKILSS